MKRVRATPWVRLAWAVVAIGSSAFAQALDAPPALATASSETPEEAKARTAADRFLDLLRKRPRLGTALDKVYGYHVGRGSLDAFVESLAKEADASNDGNAWLILGMVQMRRGQDAQAAIALEKAEGRLPDDALASYYLGKTLVVLGEVDKAAAAMRRAIDRKPARPDLLAIFQDLGRVYQRTGRNTEALDTWKQLEAQFPGDVQVREQIAGILAEEGATQAALERYEALAATSKDKFRRVEHAVRAAQLKAQLGKSAEALADLEAQLAVVNPDSWLYRDVRRRIEEVFWASGDVDGLVAYYTTWIAKHPDDVDAMMRAARALSVQRRLPEAEKWFRDAIAKGPSLSEPRLALVESLAADDRFAEAAEEMGKLVELAPDNPDSIVRWGELVFRDAKRTQDARRTEAAAIWRRMLERRGDDPVTVARVADLLRSTEASDAAIELYRRAIALAPAEPQYREYLGEYLHQLGRKDEALATWRELAAGDRETRDNLVRLSEVLGTFHYPDEALAAIAKACEMKPTFGHRARYAELLREAGKHEESLAQLDLAEPMAEDPELRELVIEERIKNYQASGTLAERIEEAAASVAGAGGQDPARWRLLALLRDADRKFQQACDAIAEATELAPGNAGIWETAATLQERAGRFGDAVASYRRLATLDRRFLSNYLTQIASLEMRLGNTAAALEAGDDLLASAPGNSEHFRFFADLCFQTGDPRRGLDALRRNVRANPNDEDALVHLAKVLGEEFETDEAIELYWRAFDLAKDVEGRTAVIAPLTELYLRTNKFDTLVERLETIGREANKPRDGVLWVAAAHQAAGDLGRAKETLEKLVREDSRDVKLLTQLVALARAESDFESAAEYQKRVVAAAPSPEAEFLLCTILLELGELSDAEALWLKLSQRSGDSQALSATISTLLGKEEYGLAAKVIEKAIARQPSDWELYAPAMIAFVKLDRKDDARRLADRVLAMNVAPATPTRKAQEAAQKQTSRRNQGNGGDPYADLGLPLRLVYRVEEIRASLKGDGAQYNPGRGTYAVTCFQDVQALAYCIPLVTADDDSDTSAFIKQYVERALETRDSDSLWRALFYVTWQTPGLQYSDTPSDDRYDTLLDALLEKEDPFAATSWIMKLVNVRQSQSGGDPNKIKPLEKQELDDLKRYSEMASRCPSGAGGHLELLVAIELARAGEEDAAYEIIDTYIAGARNLPSGVYASFQILSALVGDDPSRTPSPKAIAKALELLETTLAHTKITAGGGSDLGQMLGYVLGQLVKHGRMDEALLALDKILEWQAAQTALLRPSQRERMQSRGATPLTSFRLVNGRHEQVVVTFPPASAYLGAEAIRSVHALHEACKDDDAKLARLKDSVATLAAEPSDNPNLRVARLLAEAGVLSWSGERDRAADVLSAAEALQVDAQVLASARTRLLYESGRVAEALAEVERLRPTNQQMLVDRELAILQLVLQQGDLDRARASAQKLFALRLESDTEFKLADLMVQLGMKDLADRMMGRIRRRAGGQQDMLVRLMTRYADANDKAAAGEIARQVIRRTSPAANQYTYSVDGQQHEQAVRVLHQAGELDALIEQYESLVARSPRSTKLVDKLCAFYEAAGRRADAQSLRVRSSETAPDDPRSLVAAGQQLSALKRYGEAADKFTAAILKSPQLLDRYYEMEAAYREAKAWGRLSDAIVKHGIGKFSQSYRLGELCSQLGQQGDQAALNRLLTAALSDLSWSDMSVMMSSLGSIDLEPDPARVSLLEKKLTAGGAELANVSTSVFVWSRGPNGNTSGFVDGVARIVAADDALSERVAQAMAKRLEKAPGELFPRVLVCLVRANQKRFDDVATAIQPLVDKKDKNAADGRALWCVASMLTHTAKKPDLACKVLESADRRMFQEERSSGFQWTAMALLAFSYEQAGRKADAYRILVEELRTKEIDQTQSQFNPGYGEYQFMESLCGLSERLLEMGYPAEAFIAWRRAFADPSMVERAAQWGGMVANRRDTLRKQIAANRTSESLLAIIQASLTDDDISQTAAQAVAILTNPLIERSSLVDTRVTMPLAEFIEVSRPQDVRDAVSQFLAEHPVPEDAGTRSLKRLVARLLICDAVNDTSQAAATATAITQWVEAHPPPAATTLLPDELLLGMAALRMPESVDQADVVSMLERAIAAATASHQAPLVSSLQCQIARHVAGTDPDRARALLRQTLDELLPPGPDRASGAAGKEGE